MNRLRSAAVCVLAQGEEQRPRAQRLAAQRDLPLCEQEAGNYSFVLAFTPDRLELRTTDRSAGPLTVDFAAGAVRHRRLYGGGRGQPIARAVGLKGGQPPAVLDATGGLGRDAFVLASLGCKVTLIERSPIVAALLRDGIERASAVPEVADVIARMSLWEGDARRIMEETQAADVIYLDPMYPERQKSALVKKEMRYLQALVGSDEDAHELLACALSHARQRVVVKRPRGAAALAGPAPSMAIETRNTRFDVYVIKALG